MQLQPGIKEAAKAFWDHVRRRTPPVLRDGSDESFVYEALLVALAVMNGEARKAERERCATVAESDPNPCPVCNVSGDCPDARGLAIAAKIREGA